MLSSSFARRVASLACALLPVACADPSLPRSASADFNRWWHDGNAELDGYRLTVQRYGEERVGQAVMIFVTEPFSASKRVKLDDPGRAGDDAVDALKLNFTRDFQTGVYDYNTMVSHFTRTADFEPLKVTFSSAEWCGHVYEEMIFSPAAISQRVHSYFEGESTADNLPRREGGVDEDALFVLLRGLDGDFLAAGASRSVPLLPGTFRRRLRHEPPDWTTATISRASQPEAIEVAGGRFSCMVYRVTVADGREGTFHIEQDYPHRIVQWSWRGAGGAVTEGDDAGELTGTARMQYWRLHDEGDESYLEQLGLRPLPR